MADELRSILEDYQRYSPSASNRRLSLSPPHPQNRSSSSQFLHHPRHTDQPCQKLFSSLLSMSSHMWPALVPESLLVDLWISVKDEALKQIYQQIGVSDGQTEVLFDNEMLISIISVFLSQCPDLPYDVFWEECSTALVHMANSDPIEVVLCNIYRVRQLLQCLLHLLIASTPCKSPFSQTLFEEASLLRLFILLRLTTDDGSMTESLVNLFPDLNSYKNLPVVRFSFHVLVDLCQTCHQTVSQFPDLIQLSGKLLYELHSVDEDEWCGCSSVLFHQIVQAYMEKGPTLVEEEPTKTLLGLFSVSSLAPLFLDCITFYPLSTDQNSGYVSAAFQIFEVVYMRHPQTLLSCSLSKAVQEQSNMVFLRLQCLNLVRRIQSSELNVDLDMLEDTEDYIWPDECTKILFTIILQDTSVRVRRLAMQIFMHLCETFCDTVNKDTIEQILMICLLKIRDQDEKIRNMAFEAFRRFPMKILIEFLSSNEWSVISKGLFSATNSEACESLILDFVTTDILSEPPSSRLRDLGLLAEPEALTSENRYSLFLHNHIEAIFNKEICHWMSDEEAVCNLNNC